ncbi:hypothetical protein Csa_006759, partial [Cucumis sativus]
MEALRQRLSGTVNRGAVDVDGEDDGEQLDNDEEGQLPTMKIGEEVGDPRVL